MNSQLRVYNCLLNVISHSAGADRMVNRRCSFINVCHHLINALHFGARQYFMLNDAAKRRGVCQLSKPLSCKQHGSFICRGRKRVRQNGGGVFWPGALNVDAAATFRTTRLSTQQKSWNCLLYTSPSPRDRQKPRMPSSA